MNPNAWTPEQDNLLIAWHFDDGLSMAEVAKKLSERFSREFTRNSCCGRFNRLGLVSDKSSTLRKMRANLEKARVAPRRPRPYKLAYTPKIILSCETLPSEADEPLHLCLDDLNQNTCRWPLGGGPYTFCGHLPMTGLPYCPAHTRLAIQPRRSA